MRRPGSPRKYSLIFACLVAFFAVCTASFSTFAWFQINTSVSPNSTLQTGSLRTDAFVYNKKANHPNDDAANKTVTGDEGDTLVYDHSKDNVPADWYIVMKRGGGTLNTSDAIQMYKNKNNSGDIGAYYRMHFNAGDEFKIASGSRQDWLGYESLANGSTYYSNFSGVDDTDGEKRIRCSTETVADVFVNDSRKIFIQKHNVYDEDVNLGNGVGYYIVGTGTDNKSLFKGKDFAIGDGYALNFDSNASSEGYEGAYYGLHLYPGDKILVWDGNGENGWYQWSSRDTTNSDALGCFQSTNVTTSASGTSHTYASFECKSGCEGYYDFFVSGTMGAYGYSHKIIINRHVEGDSKSGSGAVKAAPGPRRASSTISQRTTIWWKDTGSVGITPYITYCIGLDWIHDKSIGGVPKGLQPMTIGTNSAGDLWAWYTLPANVKTIILVHSNDGSDWTGQTDDINMSSRNDDCSNQITTESANNRFGSGSWSTYNFSYTASYNNNGGSGSISNSTLKFDGSTALNSGSSFSKSNHNITSWNTASGGNGRSYALSATGSAISYGNCPTRVVNDTVTFYAQWTRSSYTATIEVYNASTSTSLGSFTASASSSSDYYPSYSVAELLTNVTSSLPSSSYRLDGYLTSNRSAYYVETTPTSDFSICAQISLNDTGFANAPDTDSVGNEAAGHSVVGHSFTSGSDLYNSHWRYDRSHRMVQYSDNPDNKGLAYIKLKSGDQFKIRSTSADTWYAWDNVQSEGDKSKFEAGTVGDQNNNIKCKEDGIYAIFCNSVGNLSIYKITNKPGYYLVGNTASMGSWTMGNSSYYRYTSGSFGVVSLAANNVFKVYFHTMNTSSKAEYTYYLGLKDTDNANNIKATLTEDGANSSYFGDSEDTYHNIKCLSASSYKISATANTDPKSATIAILRYNSALADGYYLVGDFNSWTPSSAANRYAASLASTASFSSVAAGALSDIKVYYYSSGYKEAEYGWTDSSNSTYFVAKNGYDGDKVEFRYGGTYTVTFDSSHNFGISSAVLNSNSFQINGATNMARTDDSTASLNKFSATISLGVGASFQVDAASNNSQAHGHWGWRNLASASKADFYEGTTLVSAYDDDNYVIHSRFHHTEVVVTFALEASFDSAITIDYGNDDNTSYTANNVDNATGIYFAWGHNDDTAYTSMNQEFSRARMNYDPDKTNTYKYSTGDWTNSPNIDKKATVKVTLNEGSYCSVLHNLDAFISLHDITQHAIKKSDNSTLLDASAGTEYSKTFYLPAGTYIIYLFGQDGCSPFYPSEANTTYRVVAKAVTSLGVVSQIHEVPVYAVGRGMPGSVLENGDCTATKAGTINRYIPFYAAANQTDDYPCYASAGATANNGVTLKAGDTFVFSDGSLTKTTFTNSAGTDYIAVENSKIKVKVSGVYKIDVTSNDQTFASAAFTITRVSGTISQGGNDSTLEAQDGGPAAYSKDSGVRALYASGSTLNFGGALDVSYLDTDNTYATFTVELRHINKNTAGKISASFAGDLDPNLQYRFVYGTQSSGGTDVTAIDNTVTYSSWDNSTTIYSNRDIGINTQANTSYDTCYAAYTLIEFRIPLEEFAKSGDRLSYAISFGINISFQESI